jgi:Uma2 family endonuclease
MQVPEQEEAMPSFNHSYICTQILRCLFQQEDMFPLPELTLDIGNGLTPDISVYPKKQVRPNLFRDIPRFPEMPILAVEIVSANQNIQDLLEKAAQLVQAGVQSVWTVEPFTQSVFVTTEQGDRLVHNDAVSSAGITVDFQKVFAA